MWVTNAQKLEFFTDDLGDNSTRSSKMSYHDPSRDNRRDGAWVA